MMIQRLIRFDFIVFCLVFLFVFLLVFLLVFRFVFVLVFLFVFLRAPPPTLMPDDRAS